MTNISSLIALSLSFTAVLGARPASADETTIILVFPIEDLSGRLDGPTRTTLSDYLASRIGGLPGCSLVPQDELKKKLSSTKASSYQECFDQSCQIELGKELAANQVVTTKIGAVGSQCIVTSYLFDLARAATDATATAKTACSEDALVDAVDKVVARFAEARSPKVDLTVQATPPPPPIEPPGVVATVADDDEPFPWWWVAASVVAVGAGVALDVAPASASNGEVDALDFVPAGLYAAGAASAALAVVGAL